jgi:hypothetical protein
MIFCSVFQPNPVFTSVTVTNLTPAGFVKNSAAGLLSTEAFGANTYIPYSSGTGFSYSENLTFNGTLFSVVGNSRGSFVQAGGASGSFPTVSALQINKSITAGASQYAFGFTIEGTYIAASNRSAYGMWMNPNLYGGASDSIHGFYAGLNARSDLGTIPKAHAAYLAAMTKNASGTVTNAYGLTVAAQTIGSTSNWTIYCLGGNSAFGGNTSFGKVTAPTVSVDGIAGLFSTTLGVTGLITATGGIVVSDLTAGRVTFAGASGRLVDDADLTFSTDTLMATKGDIGFPHGSFSDSTTQTWASITTAYPITFNTDEIKSQITHSTLTNPSRVYVDVAGVYLISFSACTSSPSGSGHVNLWLRKNGTDIARSNTTTELLELVQTVITVTFIISLAANDYVEVVGNSKDVANCTLNATGVQTTPDVPASPSIIFTINKISK